MKLTYLVRGASALVLMSAALIAQIPGQRDVAPLKNWPTPLYWQKSPAEKGAQSTTEAVKPDLQFPAGVSTDALTFVAMTPCRLVDTRSAYNPSGYTSPYPFGPGTLVANVAQVYQVRASTSCLVPPLAQAYSFNVTAVNTFLNVGYISISPTSVVTAAVLVFDRGTPFVSSGTIVAANLLVGGQQQRGGRRHRH